MIKQGKDIRVYNNTLAKSDSYFTGGLNLQKLEFDPFLTGYAFIIWTKLPNWLKSEYPGFQAMTQKNFKSLQGISDIEIDAQSYQYGFANNDYNVAGGITKGNTEITLKHQEYSGSPIKNMYQLWTTGIRDPETGIATYPKLYGVDYGAKNHTAEMMYIVTRPDANNTDKKNIEFAAYFTNMWPTKIPLAHLNYDQGDKALVEIEEPFKCNMHMSPAIDNYAATLLKTCYAFKSDGMFEPLDPNAAGKNITEFKQLESITGDTEGDPI